MLYYTIVASSCSVSFFKVSLHFDHKIDVKKVIILLVDFNVLRNSDKAIHTCKTGELEGLVEVGGSGRLPSAY